MGHWYFGVCQDPRDWHRPLHEREIASGIKDGKVVFTVPFLEQERGMDITNLRAKEKRDRKEEKQEVSLYKP